MIKRIFIFLSILGLGYFIGAFCNWRINPGEWDSVARGVLGIFVPIFAAGAFIPYPKDW